MSVISSIWRHPIKAIGREKVTSVSLIAGQSMPMDRVWALAHDASKAQAGEWARCVNFYRAAGIPALMAITTRFDPASGTMELYHPDLPDLAFKPDENPNALIEWLTPLIPAKRAQPKQLMRLDGHGYTDSNYPSISIANLASHADVEKQLGRSLSLHRWRSNIWLEGLEPWAEFAWVGREIAIGEAVLRIKEPATRCMATTANPETGQRDADTLGALNHFGHQDFSVLAEVIQSGTIAIGGNVQVL